MTCIQTVLWYQCYFLVYTIMARSPSRPDSRLRASLPRISSCHPRALRQQDPFTYKLEATFKTYYTQGVTPGEVEHLFMHEYNRTGREYYLTFSPDSWISNYETVDDDRHERAQRGLEDSELLGEVSLPLAARAAAATGEAARG